MKQYIRFFIIIFLSISSGYILANDRKKSVITIDPDHVNLSTKDFMTFYTRGSSLGKETLLMYVLGVSDATEGKTWCGYNRIDELALYPPVLEYLRQQSVKKAHTRASTVIAEALARTFPCQNTSLPEKIPQQKSPVLHLMPGTFNLSCSDFFRFWQSDDPRDRRNAKIYLLGVEDASESNIWCQYKTIKTVTLDELIYWHFKKLPREKLNQRAVTVILEELSHYPCNKGDDK